MTGDPFTELACMFECESHHASRARHVLETFGMSLGFRLRLAGREESTRPLLVYSADSLRWRRDPGVVAMHYDPGAWEDLDVGRLAGLAVELQTEGADGIPEFDLLATAFFFLSARSEKARSGSRQLYRDSVFHHHGIRQDVVDRFMHVVRLRLAEAGIPDWSNDGSRQALWGGHEYAVALTHDVDYLPVRSWDNVKVAAKTAARHLFKQRAPAEAAEAVGAYLKAALRGEDPYGCVPALIAEEQRRGVKSSFQVAVGHRHPFDVNYRIEDDRIRDYLAIIRAEDFDLCLHGSYRSTEQPAWYEQEVELLGRRLGRPLGSRQHYLSFDADTLFAAQERAGIQYDMSMGYPDRCGSRVGFSHAYFPYSLAEERPYRVLQIPLVLMDATLRGYMDLRGEEAWSEIVRQLDTVRRSGGAVSVVWHPIVFGGARDPGFDRLYWRLVEYVKSTNGLATDGRTINALVRQRAGKGAT